MKLFKENKMKCKDCKKRDVGVKKYSLCPACYQAMRKRTQKNGSIFYCHPIKNKHKQEVRFPREMEFVRNFFNHKNWLYTPATFQLGFKSYTPDFYDGERNVFIEVVGTRQAFYDNQESYRAFINIFPKINFEIRLMDGQQIDVEAPHINSTLKNIDESAILAQKQA